MVRIQSSSFLMNRVNLMLRSLLSVLVLLVWVNDAPTAELEPDKNSIGEALDSVSNGDLWLDTQGVHINAHGGGVLNHDGKYYWFGEHKTKGRKGNVANVGVRCYSSTDLLNWKNEGVVLPVSGDPNSDITKGCVLERPKVIYNAKTDMFVMWFHLELKGKGYSAARTGVAVADNVTGAYRFLYSLRPHGGLWPENLSPSDAPDIESAVAQPSKEQYEAGWYVRRDVEGGQMARDMTLFVDDDRTAYHVHASEENRTLHISELTEDYQSFTGRYVRVFPGAHNEAPALFKCEGKYYMITSGCTGWSPNAARSAVADSIWGPWRDLGNPCVGKNPTNGLGPDKTFGGQSTHVLPIEGKPGKFVAMFDEWRPHDAIDGRYYWLPIELTTDGFRIQWVDEWRPQESLKVPLPSD